MAGAIGVLAVTVTVVSFVLIQGDRRILTQEIENSVILQGRNVALASEKALLSSDPEFELYPLVARMSERNKSIISVTITDSSSVMLAGVELQKIAEKVDLILADYPPKSSPYLEAGEVLYETGDAFFVKSPVRSLGRDIGFVYLEYSKDGLRASLRKAVTMTVICALGAFVAAIVAALHLFRRISRPVGALMKGVEFFGRGELSTRIAARGSREFRVLAHSFNEMATRIVAAQEELVDKKVTDRELAVARDIQATLIPAAVFEPPGYRIGLHYRAARKVGGDYIDVVRVDAHRAALVVADVSGKGIPGLVVMGMLKIMVHESLRKIGDPSAIMRHLNTSIARYLRKNMFVTMFLGVLDSRSGELKYSCAGHVPTLVYRKSSASAELIKIKVPPLGFLPDEEFSPKLVEKRFELSKGDVVLQYTDGLIESMGPRGDMFGYERMVEVCRAHGAEGPLKLVEALISSEARFRGAAAQRDDVSILCVGSVAPVPESLGVAG